jgi:hypothetical protein
MIDDDDVSAWKLPTAIKTRAEFVKAAEGVARRQNVTPKSTARESCTYGIQISSDRL